jgi:hypothetical protein
MGSMVGSLSLHEEMTERRRSVMGAGAEGRWSGRVATPGAT